MEKLHLTMKELPDSERPYEKAAQYGTQILSDSELLAIILRTGSRSEKAIDLAQRLLLLSDQEKKLVGLMDKTMEELKSVKGIGFVKSIQIKAIFELAKRISKSEALQKVKINSPGSVANIYMEEMRYLKQEQIRIVYLDTKNQILGDDVLTVGSVNASILDPRDVFISALKKNAVNIIMIHNHPSGDPTPSREDYMITRRVKEGGDLLGVKVLDHLIIGDGRYISLKEKGTI